MSQSYINKSTEIILKSEDLADKILANKRELIDLDKRRQDNREALRLTEKLEEPKVWITVGSMLVKVKRDKATELIKKDQQQIEVEYNKVYSNQKVMVNKHRNLEYKAPFSGTNIQPLTPQESNALKASRIIPF